MGSGRRSPTPFFSCETHPRKHSFRRRARVRSRLTRPFPLVHGEGGLCHPTSNQRYNGTAFFSCVLAGSPKLEGVGLVSAFKYVRDGADQEDTVRLQNILDSMPQKILANIDATKHEETLAQSEAVFYYHVVTQQDRCNRPICEPRVSEIESGVEHSQDHHLPLMTRFEDSSFIGDTSSPGKSQPAARSSNQRKRSGKRVPIRVPERTE